MILRSFYARLSILFLILVFILGGVTIFVAFDASTHLFDEVDQIINREYAANISVELSAIVEDDPTGEKIKEAIHYMMVLNPNVEIYLIDSDGLIISYFTGEGKNIVRNRIDPKPLEMFQASQGLESIKGDDPRTEDEKKPFSAAPMQINGEPGWVYVILRGQGFDSSLSLVKSNYYIRSGISTFLIALLFTLIAGLFLFFILTNRLRQLSEDVQIFKEGKYTHRTKISGNDELAQFASTFNEMAKSIEEGIQKLKESDHQRSQLIANISHDLRSPLTSIRGHLETLLLEENNISEKKKREYVEITLRNVASFQRLVEELLDLARFEAGDITLEKLSFSIAELLQDVVLKMRGQSDSNEIKIQYNPDPNLPFFKGDIGLFERAVTNILANAIEHTPKKGIVKVDLSFNNGLYQILISDSGQGIPEENLPHIFERFYRVDKSRNRNTKSTGLGLAIAKEVVELHGGIIEAKNSVDGGALFTITLPLIS
ncbi:MAG: HAMP domain-containing sensor histidine kinase [Sphaerochaetaceae bacterium]|nr:HAMP domain-containing sensor histidine kinase [Sphaerochaetaceae bacterium]MDC7244195.1 HAMP domain-containing sensor histidine kinase [Sphaerochaetaceae bacterium]